jgi:serine/threonine protein kinase
MLLIAESEDNLRKLSSEELYERQAKADIYFLGVNIYTMVFSQLFESFNGGKVLNNLINIKKRSGFSSKLLDLMSRCLEKDSHVRVSLEEVVKILSDIER